MIAYYNLKSSGKEGNIPLFLISQYANLLSSRNTNENRTQSGAVHIYLKLNTAFSTAILPRNS